ncbi:MAG: manganese efflux pump [Spirochaetes bacterium]|nr:manganese efflux pump [Spirochaetota bacterium]
MEAINYIGIAVGLAMDAFSVAVAAGAVVCAIRVRSALRIGATFGLFQFLMPIVGWLLAVRFRSSIEHLDHWIAFILLAFLGGKMIYESFGIEKKESRFTLLSFRWLIALGIATSIDALIVGVTFALLGTAIMVPSVVIGVVAFLFSFAGFIIGCRIGHLFENRIEVFGGIVLVGIGVKILVEHLFF